MFITISIYYFMNLINKLIYILGGNGLIGRETVKILSSSGAKIIIIDKNINKNLDKDKLNSQKSSIIQTKFDLEKLNLLEKNLNKIILKYRTPDIFINCAYPKSLDWKKNNFENIDLKSFKKNIEIQLISSAWTNYLIAKKMKSFKKKGKIIQIGSIYGKISQDPELYKGTSIKENFTYPLIKGGMSKFMQQMAVYYAKYNISINSISPGGIKSNQDKNFVKKYSAKTPISRMAEPQEVASFIRFLCLEQSSYIIGQDLVIDGGFSKI